MNRNRDVEARGQKFELIGTLEKLTLKENVKENVINCFYTNPTSLNNKQLDLLNVLEGEQPDVAFFSETHYDQDSNPIMFNNYELYRKDRGHQTGGGGVCIYIKKIFWFL